MIFEGLRKNKNAIAGAALGALATHGIDNKLQQPDSVPQSVAAEPNSPGTTPQLTGTPQEYTPATPNAPIIFLTEKINQIREEARHVIADLNERFEKLSPEQQFMAVKEVVSKYVDANYHQEVASRYDKLRNRIIKSYANPYDELALAAVRLPDVNKHLVELLQKEIEERIQGEIHETKS